MVPVKVRQLQVRVDARAPDRAWRPLVFCAVELACGGIPQGRLCTHPRGRRRGPRFLDMDGLIVPSARWPCASLVLFLDRLADLESLSVVEQRDVNWPAWRERQVPKN